MQKIKTISFSGFLSMLKCCLLGIVTTLLGIVIFAVVLKFADVTSTAVGYVNNAIKGVSLFVAMATAKKVKREKLVFRSVGVGLLYAILCFLIFSILNGSFVFNASFVYDLVFAVIVAVIVSILLNVIGSRN